jgi:hypothetical protein
MFPSEDRKTVVGIAIVYKTTSTRHQQQSITMNMILNSLPSDIWITVASFLPSIRDFMRFWVECQKLQESFPKDHKIWKEMLEHFLIVRGFNMDEVVEASFEILTLSTKTKNAKQPFHLIELLFCKRKCSRSGCLRYFEAWNNRYDSCQYHPGRMKYGTSLSCCGASSFQAMGCKLARHDGMFHFALLSFRDIPQTNEKDKKQNTPDSKASLSFLPVIASSSKQSNQANSTSTINTNTFQSLPPIILK